MEILDLERICDGFPGLTSGANQVPQPIVFELAFSGV